MRLKIERDGFTPLPNNRYLVRVVSVEQVEWQSVGPALRWTFEVLEGAYTGCRLCGNTNLSNSLGPRQKFGRWYHAIIGRFLVVGEQIDTNELVGKRCWAEVVLRRSRTGKPANQIELVPQEEADGIARPSL